MRSYQSYKTEVLKSATWLSENGFFGTILGSGGNVSVRIPDEEKIAVTPTGRTYQEMAPRDICIVDFDLNKVEGDLNPSIETAMHMGIYEMRSDVKAVVHTHQTYASILSVINTPIPTLFDEVALYIGKTVDIIPYAASGSRDLAENVKQKLGNNCFCYIIQNHGALSLGKDLETAVKNAELMEKAANIYYRALCTGKPVTKLPDGSLERLRDVLGL